MISYGKTLNRGDRIADCRAAPRATASSAFIVVDRVSTPKISFSLFLTNPMRVLPPTISTELKSLAASPASASAFFNGPSRRASKGAHIASYSSAFSMIWKSKSSMRHSRLIDASFTPVGLRVFLAFSAAATTLTMTLGLSCGFEDSFLEYFSTNLSAIHSAIVSSKERPPKSAS